MREKGASEKGNELKKLSSKKEDKLRLGGAKGGVNCGQKKKRMFFFFLLLLSFFLLPFLPLPYYPTLTFGTANLHPTLQIARVKRVSKMGGDEPRQIRYR